ncbi:MAG: hypothetical protein JXR96_29360 [Deltaproteobacteria bacterium]|nr:hypothetical protein [Deltaproteobacteria bacterium]
MKATVCLGIALALLAGPALARDLYVRAGSSGNGSQASPYGTIDEALRDAYSGDVIHVAAGTYYGPGGSGKFVIDKPDISLVGGYSADFSKRQPFEFITRLMRGEDPDTAMCRKSKRCTALVTRQKVPKTKASYNAKSIVQGEKDHSRAVIDGFVIDGYTRHMYKPNEDLSLKKGPVGTPGLDFSKPGVKVRNCIVINIAGPGIRMGALGTKLPKGDKRESGPDWGEVSNCIVANTLHTSLEFRVGNMDEKNSPDGGAALIKNNTLVFNWEKLGEDYNLLQGRQTRLTVQDNILAFAGFGINNGFGNRFGRYLGNVFYGHTKGAYKYWDQKASKETLVLDDVTKLAGKKCKKIYACSKQSEGNLTAKPAFAKLDGFFLDKFMNQIASSGGGKVTMDVMNQWRSAHGLALQGSKGSGRVNYAPIYDPGDDWSAAMFFSSAQSGKGAQRSGIGGKFQTYKSAAGAAAAKSYQEVAWDDIKPRMKLCGAIAAKGEQGMDVQVTLKIGPRDMSSYYMPASAGVSRDKGWECYKDKSMGIYLYVMRGTEAHETLKQALSEGADVILYGTAYDVSAQVKSSGRIGIKIDKLETDDED